MYSARQGQERNKTFAARGLKSITFITQMGKQVREGKRVPELGNGHMAELDSNSLS